jgi:hypothetical protein
MPCMRSRSLIRDPLRLRMPWSPATKSSGAIRYGERVSLYMGGTLQPTLPTVARSSSTSPSQLSELTRGTGCRTARLEERRVTGVWDDHGAPLNTRFHYRP